MDDLADLDVEVLDDELLGTPGKDQPASASAPAASVAKANPLTSLPPLRKPQQLAPLPPIGGAKPLAAPRALAPVRGGSGASAPTAEALTARAKAEASQSQAAPARVSGSLMVTGDDTSSSEDSDDDDDDDGSGGGVVAKSEADRPTGTTRSTADPKEGVPTNVPSLDAFGDEGGSDAEAADEIRRGVEKASTTTARTSPPRPETAFGDAAVDAVDAIDALDAAASAESRASQLGVRRLAEKYEDAFELRLDADDEKAAERADASSAAGAGAGADDDDDEEFGYAFEGETRAGATHRAEFKARPMPAALVTDVKSMPMETFAEEEEEEEEESVSPRERAGDDGSGDAEDAVDFSDSRAEAPGAAPDEWDAANAERDAERDAERMSTPASTPGDSSARAKGDAPRAKTTPRRKKRKAPSLPLSYAAARAYFAEDEIDDDLRASLDVEDESTVMPSGCCGSLIAMVTGSRPAKLSDALRDERDSVFAAAKTAFSNADESHAHLLNATYMRFLGTETPPARVGAHWDRLGFQGADPATDLRGCGMLGLLQLFFLVAGDGETETARAIFALSRDATREFPMAPLGINVTKAALKALRLGHLNETANACGSVWDALDRFYKGAWIEFFVRWRDGRCTMAQSGFVTKEWETFVTSGKGAKRALALANAGIPPEPSGGKPADEAEAEGGEEEEEEEPEFTSF